MRPRRRSNNHWGVPLSLSRLAESARYGVFEIGMNHAGEITPLTRLVRPHVAIVTTVEPVHLEFFASVEAIADAKAEIFLGLEKDGAALLNRDNAQYQRLKRHADAVWHPPWSRSARTRVPMRGSSNARCSPTARRSKRTSSVFPLPTRSVRRASIW